MSTTDEPLVVYVQHDHCGGVVSLDTVTTRETPVVRVTPPLVPLTMRLYVPVGVELAALIVIVVEPEPVTEDGEKLAVAPEGRPLMPKVVGLLEDDKEVTVILKLLELPRSTVSDWAEDDSVKSLRSPYTST